MADEKSYRDAEGHEYRIQKVEGQLADLSTAVAKNELQLQYLNKDVVSGMENVVTAMEKGFEGVKTQLGEGSQRMEAMSERIGEHDRKLERIGDEKSRSRERWEAVKKWFIPAITGAGAIGLKELAVFLFKHL
jgi:predicted ribonuclease toxin of YeeF-YezG toxin-antitoxin module